MQLLYDRHLRVCLLAPVRLIFPHLYSLLSSLPAGFWSVQTPEEETKTNRCIFNLLLYLTSSFFFAVADS